MWDGTSDPLVVPQTVHQLPNTSVANAGVQVESHSSQTRHPLKAGLLVAQTVLPRCTVPSEGLVLRVTEQQQSVTQ